MQPFISKTINGKAYGLTNMTDGELMQTNQSSQAVEQETKLVTKNILLIGQNTESVNEKLIESISVDLQLFINKQKSQAIQAERSRVAELIEKQQTVDIYRISGGWPQELIDKNELLQALKESNV